MAPDTAGDSELAQIADLALTHLSSAPDSLMRFMTESGHDPQSLRAALGTPGLALGLLDYFARNESELLALCANADLSTARFMRVWARHNQAPD